MKDRWLYPGNWMRDDVAINLAFAAIRLDAAGLTYPEPVRTDRLRIVFWDWFFKIPGLRRFDGFTLCPWLIIMRPGFERNNDLYTHELTHVWQFQSEGWLKVSLSYLRVGYDKNPFEEEARFAVWVTEYILAAIPEAA
jgi:hypothetical protein